ncbi:MAG TPA: endo-1,4-beta-xylanase [Bacteroidota bacterium]|nr:endo-1,4-beta-xylanase [Bacteroidota bacterium]
MKRSTKRGWVLAAVMGILFWCSNTSPVQAQLVTNGGFESSNVGDITATGTKGWVISVAAGITPPPVFQIVGDTVEEGNRAMKVSVSGLGANQWDIQAAADSIPVKPGTTYNCSIWAKAAKAGATVNFTIGDYSYSEYKALRPATLSTQWQKFSMQFTVTDNQTFIRGPIHFYGTVDSANSIYIDNLQIVDPNAGKRPVVVEAESGLRGSHFKLSQDGGVTFISTDTNWTGLTSPGDTSRMATFQVPFADSGSYNFFARVRVGSGGFNDDSFFYGNGFGQKNDTAQGDWIFINGLASGGFSDSSAFVDGPGALGTGVWKWVNLTKNPYQGAKGDSFVVALGDLNKTFQIGSREDGLDIDKIAFGKSNLYFTVHDLDSVVAGSTSLAPDTGTVWNGPALATGQDKFLGNAYGDVADNIFAKYWTQLTPGNAGKWGSIAGTSDSTSWNWTGLNTEYNYAVNNGLVFKDHNLIWGQQQPSWISSLDSATQYRYIDTWIRMVGQRYPKINMIDVVNEPLNGHNPPDGGGSPARANYEKALGGTGSTGWDWLITAFGLARKYLPNAKLLINDYGIINDNSATTSYIQIINLLKSRSLIDGIGVQGHRFELESADTATLKSNLDKLAATGLPVYISEFDLGNLNNSGTPDDNQQLQLYKKIFPILWKHPGVKGITLWGYLEGQTWQSTCYLVRSDGTARPALLWLAQYVKDNPAGVEEKASELPSSFALAQNYPNPFNPTTKIVYSIAKSSKVTLKVFDILGREVETLVNGVQPQGSYTVTFNAHHLSSGVYFYQLNAGSFSQTKKLILLK